MESYKGTVEESLKPTFENVTREFITETLYKILFDKYIPNFKFEFREDEAIDFIEKVLKDYYGSYQEKSQKILQTIKQKSDKNTTVSNYKKFFELLRQSIKQKSDEDTATPVMVVNNHKKFFELLRQFYEKDIELYFSRTGRLDFPRFEKNNCFEQIWLRATPDDFNNPEEFLKKQVDMINDSTFEKYDEETCLGKIKFLDDHILCVRNCIARTWDENSREIEMTIYDKDDYYNKDVFNRQCYTLPVIRYGIYEKNGKKVCSIGSIQDKSDSYEQTSLSKQINRKRYKANEGISEEYTYHVEPKNILALSIFLNLLSKEGITEIEVPSLYVLDYEYHEKRNGTILEDFKTDWTEEDIKKYPDLYKKAYYYFERCYKKEDLISEIKTERLLVTFRRLLQHYPNGSITSYPGDVDSFMHLHIPIVKSENDINGVVFKELYKLNAQLDNGIEI